jgi:AraC family transcriptional regulator
MKAALQNYQARMRRVLDYIDRHLDSDMDLETVSDVAAFSKFPLTPTRSSRAACSLYRRSPG